MRKHHFNSKSLTEPLLNLFASLLHRWRAPRMRDAVSHVIGLAPNAVAGFIVRRGKVRITCLSGSLWITCSDDLRDYMLTAGEHFVPRSRGRLVMQAQPLSAARFLVER
jgi:hypothetical protein